MFLHFVPVYSKMGYLDTAPITKPGYVNSNLCIGYLKPVNDNYRLVPNGLNDFNSDRTILRPQDSGCDKWVHLRLYLL